MTTAADRQFCTFFLEGLLFGVDLRNVQEVIRFHKMTRVPRAPGAVRGLLNLRGQIVTASDAPTWVAAYSAHGGIIAVCLCDLPFAAYAGAALSLIPLPVAQESIRGKRLDASLSDNLHEILNIFSQVFRGKILDSVTLHKVSTLSDLEEGPAKNLLNSPKSSRLDLEVSIDGYGDGHLAIFS